MEKLNGTTLNDYIFQNNPFIIEKVNRNREIEYFKKILLLIENLLYSVKVIHDNGICINDMSPANILIENKEKMKDKIIDLEAAHNINTEDKDINNLNTPGFRDFLSTKDNIKKEIRKLGLIFINCLLPINNLYELNFTKASDLIKWMNKFNYIPKTLLKITKMMLNGEFNNIDEVLNIYHKSMENKTQLETDKEKKGT
jgi:serine/threonine protein kinase